MEEFESFKLGEYNPKNWSGPWMSSVAMDQRDLFPLDLFPLTDLCIKNDPMMGIPETYNLPSENPMEFSTDCLVPSEIMLDSHELFDLNLEQEFKLIGDMCFDPILMGELDEDIINQSNSNKVSYEVSLEVNYPSDSEVERKFGRESMRTVNPSDVTSYHSGLPDNSPLSKKWWLYDDKNNLLPKNWWIAEHNYCLDQSAKETIGPQANESIGVDTKKNVELEVDVWGTSCDDKSSILRSRKFARQSKLASVRFKESLNNAGTHYDVAGMNKLSRAKLSHAKLSHVSSNIMKDLQIALKTRSGSRRSARNIRPKGSVETTPSGSDFEDGFHMSMKPAPPKRMRGNRYSVGHTSNKSLSEYNFEDGSRWHLKRGQTKQMRSACRSTNKFHPYPLDSEDESPWCSNERPLKRMRTTSQSVSRTSNQANRRAPGRNVPKSTKKKTLKEKQGHKDNEKLRRDKLRDAFTSLRSEIPSNYLIRDNDKPSAMISKQKILNGAVTKVTEVLKSKKKLTQDAYLCHKTFKIYRKNLARKAQISMNSYK